jgi:hypothetical protein
MTTMAALGMPPPLSWSHGVGPVPEEDASAATVLGSNGIWGSSVGPPFSGGTGVEGLVMNPGSGGAVKDGGTPTNDVASGGTVEP